MTDVKVVITAGSKQEGLEVGKRFQRVADLMLVFNNFFAGLTEADGAKAMVAIIDDLTDGMDKLYPNGTEECVEDMAVINQIAQEIKYETHPIQ